MAAPKGNQYAKGCETNGRPCAFDLAEEAKLLMEWADTEDALVLREWAAIRRYSAQEKLQAYCAQSEDFRSAYNMARIKIGARREKMLAKGIGNAAPFQRYASLYDKELKAHEKELKDQAAASAQTVVAGDISAFMQLARDKNGSQRALPETNNRAD